MDIPNFTYRVATPDEALEVARLIEMASGGAIDFLLRSLDSELKAEESLASLLRSETGILSYRNIEVAAWNESVVGMAHSYADIHHRITEEIRQNIPENRFKVIEPLYHIPGENSWFLNALAVHSEWRELGIATSLLWRTKQKAWQSGFSTLNALAWSDNRAAIRLYHKNGFRQIRVIPIPQHPDFSHCGSRILMRCPISS